jgi:hypothetical protein
MKRRTDYKLKPEKFCERCEKQLMPRTYSSGEEEYGMFMKRRFCSLACSNTRGKTGKSRTQRMVQAREAALKETCECCGGNHKLAIHHINENWQDNSINNLQTLCVYCHQQWHGLHRRLGIPASTRMPQLASLSAHTAVKVVHKIHWGAFDPRIAPADCAPTATRSTRKRPKPSLKQ